MNKKMIYEELVKKVKEQEIELVRIKQKMETLKRNEEKSKKLLENANDLFVNIAHDGTVIGVNHKIKDIFGYAREEVLGKNFSEMGIVHPDDLVKSIDHFISVIAGNPAKMLELEAFRKDRTIVIVECNSSPVISNGKIDGILVIIRDITERKYAEKELQNSEEMSRTIFETANDLIIYVGMDGTILDINDKVADIFGYIGEEVIGKKFTDFRLFNKKNLRTVLDFYGNKMANNTLQTFEVEALRKDRSIVFIEITCRIMKKDGKIKGFFNVLRDITERKQAEAALRMHRDHLEELVKKRTSNLQEANTALKVLLKKREEDKIELEEKMLLNVKELVLPYLEKIKKNRLDNQIKTCVNIIETNLNDITSPFVRKLSSKYLNFTSGELQVANLIKHGKATKEIAQLLNLSHRTIDFHRANIRKKIGIKNLKANLRSYLLSLR